MNSAPQVTGNRAVGNLQCTVVGYAAATSESANKVTGNRAVGNVQYSGVENAAAVAALRRVVVNRAISHIHCACARENCAATAAEVPGCAVTAEGAVGDVDYAATVGAAAAAEVVRFIIDDDAVGDVDGSVVVSNAAAANVGAAVSDSHP